MRDDFDVEDVLRRYKAEPGARVKKEVLSRFAGMRGNEARLTEARDTGTRETGTARRRAPGWWKRPVPLYAAAAALVIVMGFSFAAGERRARVERQSSMAGDTLQTENTRGAADTKWVAAENDLL
jgi:hypothetical protein